MVVTNQRGEASLRRRAWKEKEPKSLGEVGEREGTMGRGIALPKKESCLGRRTLLPTEPSNGKGSPGMDLAQPSWHCGEATFKSQNAESIPVLSFTIDDDDDDLKGS